MPTLVKHAISTPKASRLKPKLKYRSDSDNDAGISFPVRSDRPARRSGLNTHLGISSRCTDALPPRSRRRDNSARPSPRTSENAAANLNRSSWSTGSTGSTPPSFLLLENTEDSSRGDANRDTLNHSWSSRGFVRKRSRIKRIRIYGIVWKSGVRA